MISALCRLLSQFKSDKKCCSSLLLLLSTLILRSDVTALDKSVNLTSAVFETMSVHANGGGKVTELALRVLARVSQIDGQTFREALRFSDWCSLFVALRDKSLGVEVVECLLHITFIFLQDDPSLAQVLSAHCAELETHLAGGIKSFVVAEKGLAILYEMYSRCDDALPSESPISAILFDSFTYHSSEAGIRDLCLRLTSLLLVRYPSLRQDIIDTGFGVAIVEYYTGSAMSSELSLLICDIVAHCSEGNSAFIREMHAKGAGKLFLGMLRDCHGYDSAGTRAVIEVILILIDGSEEISLTYCKP